MRGKCGISCRQVKTRRVTVRVIVEVAGDHEMAHSRGDAREIEVSRVMPVDAIAARCRNLIEAEIEETYASLHSADPA